MLNVGIAAVPGCIGASSWRPGCWVLLLLLLLGRQRLGGLRIGRRQYQIRLFFWVLCNYLFACCFDSLGNAVASLLRERFFELMLPCARVSVAGSEYEMTQAWHAIGFLEILHEFLTK